MISTLELGGRWNPPGDTGQVSTGTLKFSPDSGAQLVNVIGPLAASHPQPGPGPALFHGRTADAANVTLAGLHCFETQSALPSANFDVDLVVKGHLFANLNEIRFTRYKCEYSNLHYWLGNRGCISVEHLPREQGRTPVQDRHIVSVEYPALWDVTVNGTQIRYFNGLSAHSDFAHGRSTFSTKEGLQVDFQTEVPPAEFYRIERAVRGLIDLMCHAQIQRSKLVAGPTGSVEIIHVSRMGRNGRQDPDRLRIPVEFSQIEAEINPILERWLALYSSLEPSLSLFFLGLHDTDMNIENVFLGIMQALEAFHRTFFGGTFVSQEDYESSILPPLLAAIPETAHPDFRQALRNRLIYGNERSLRARLRELIQSLPTTATFQGYRENDLIGRSVETRNHFTHVVTDAAAVYGIPELFRAVQQWQEILTALILTRVGVNAGVIEGAIQTIQECRGTFIEL